MYMYMAKSDVSTPKNHIIESNIVKRIKALRRRASLAFNQFTPTTLINSMIHRGSYMSAHVLLNLLNKLRKIDKMRGLPSILSLFRN